MAEHLYTHGGKHRNLPKFRARYGSRGAEVYGRVVGKVRRERMAKGLCSARGCGVPARHYHGVHGCCGSALHHSMITGQHMVKSMGRNVLSDL